MIPTNKKMIKLASLHKKPSTESGKGQSSTSPPITQTGTS